MRHRHDAQQRSHPAWSASNNTKKSKVHRHLLISDAGAQRTCHLCTRERATLYLTTYDARTYRLQRLACCATCHTYVKAKSTTSGGDGGKHQKAQLHSSLEVALYCRVLSANV
jgi:hypothetical protein